MIRKNLFLYSGLLIILIATDSLYVWQFKLDLTGLAFLLAKDLIIIAVTRKLFLNSINRHFVTFSDNIVDPKTGQIDLTIQLPAQHNINNKINTQINHGIQHTHDAITSIEASVSRLIPMSIELADTYTATTQKTLMQTNYSQSVAESMNKMHQASTTVSEDIEQINNAIISSNKYVTSCRDAVDSTVQSIHTVSENMQRAGEKLENLKKASEEVSVVIEVINSIAEQTNLLALNAAIEAARAGEMGRGFAVVADEVRTLAERTRVSTSEVRENIERIQSQTNELVESMNQGKESTELTVQKSEGSRQQLDEIFNAVEAIQHAADQINNSIVIQTDAANEAQTSIAGLIELNTDALESTRIHSISKQDLHNLAQALRDKISLFKLNEHQWNESLRTKARTQNKADTNTAAQESSIELF